MNKFVFQHPYFLFLFLFLLPLFFWYWKRRGPSFVVPSLRTAEASITAKARKYDVKRLIPLVCFVLAGLCLTLALARPRSGLEIIRRSAEGIDIILAIDLSGSMKIIDVPANYRTERQVVDDLRSGRLANRIDVSKKEILKFIEARPDDRIGLIAFAPRPFNACPPTLDHAFLAERVRELNAGVIGEQTNIAGPLASAIHRLKDSDSKRKIIVLFTDGRSNVEDRITPKQAAALAKEFDISVYTVGIGSSRSFAIQPTMMGNRLVSVQGEFDEQLLKDIASSTGGRYYHAEDASSMEEAMKEISRLEKTSFENQSMVNWKELAPQCMLAGLVLLLIGFLLEHTLFLRFP